MTPFTESLRYDLRGITPESIVLDVGGFEANWGRLIAEKYSCRVHIFEPVDRFYGEIIARLANHPQRDRMTVHHFGLGGTTRDDVMGVKGDSSGFMAAGPRENVKILGVADLLGNSLFEGKPIAAMKINAEGAEFEILEALLEHGLMSRIDTLHVQFHAIAPRAAERMAYIKNMMGLTHELIWDAPWIWTGWESRQ